VGDGADHRRVDDSGDSAGYAVANGLTERLGSGNELARAELADESLVVGRGDGDGAEVP
jgi:hypothetical protein